MFTGLVEGIGKIKEVSRSSEEMRLTVLPQFDIQGVQIGESISVSGVCLTVTGIKEKVFTVDVSGESMSRSTMKSLTHGDEVNLERALRLTDRLGGHLVSGHIDAVGKILKKREEKRFSLLGIGIPEGLSRYTIEKGSIAVDGISLTINRCETAYFEVTIIPQTACDTTIPKKGVGDEVNIETDLIGKYLETFVTRGIARRDEATGVDRALLKKYGFGG